VRPGLLELSSDVNVEVRVPVPDVPWVPDLVHTTGSTTLQLMVTDATPKYLQNVVEAYLSWYSRTDREAASVTQLARCAESAASAAAAAAEAATLEAEAAALEAAWQEEEGELFRMQVRGISQHDGRVFSAHYA
jgi:hypothetical protein